MTPKKTKPTKNPKHRTMSFRKARLMRESERRRWEEENQRIADELGLGGEEE